MKKTTSLILCFIVIISMFFSITPAQAATQWTDKYEYVTPTTALNVRTGPGLSYSKINTVAAGNQILRLSLGSNGWSKVVVLGKVGYMKTSYLKVANYNSSLDKSGLKVGNITFTRVNDVCAATVNVAMRTGPKSSYKRVDVLNKDENVLRIGVGSNGWSQVIYKNTVVYINGSYLKIVSSTTAPLPSPDEQNKETIPTTPSATYYTTTALNVRTGPSTSYKKLGTLSKGVEVVSYGKSGKWHKIMFNNQVAYCHGDYLTTIKPTVQNASGYPKVYQDATCTITVYKEWWNNAYVYAAHIQYSDYDRLWVECAKGKYNSGTETTSNAAKRVGAILAINGDYATPGNGAGGYAIARKGVVCNDKKTYPEGVYNSNAGILLYGQSKGISGQQLSTLVKAGTVTDTFQFGPCFLLDGKIIGDKNSTSRAQRTFIGTNGKAGDIWLCVSDGRYNDGKSAGLNAYECATYLQSKGCTLGIPLDGGGSSTMYFNGQVLNAAKSGQRAVADFVVFK